MHSIISKPKITKFATSSDLYTIKDEIIDAYNNGCFVFPTDTCYGLGASPSSSKSIDKVYKVKNRERDKQISCIFMDITDISKWCEINQIQENILKKYLPGNFTFLLKPNSNYPLVGTTVGVRIPKNDYTSILSKIIKGPYTSTSANVSTYPSCYTISEFLEQSVLNRTDIYPDLIIDAGTLPFNQPSTVVDLTKTPPEIIRQGSGKFIY